MKFKTTQRDIKQGYPTVIPVGYCAMQNLLRFKEPIAYTTRAEGWGSDIYQITPSIAISTGYAPFGTVKLTSEQYNMIRVYDRKAQEVTTMRDSNKDASDQINELVRTLVNNLGL